MSCHPDKQCCSGRFAAKNKGRNLQIADQIKDSKVENKINIAVVRRAAVVLHAAAGHWYDAYGVIRLIACI